MTHLLYQQKSRKMGTLPQPASTFTAETPVEISVLPACDKQDWDQYVEEHPEGSFFHLFGWGEVIKSTYGYEPVYLVARRHDRVVGLALFVDVKAPLLGRSLISTAFTVGGGPIGDDPAVVDALGQSIIQIGEDRRVQYIEIRKNNLSLENWHTKSGKHAEFSLEIPVDPDLHLKSVPRKRRADLRKALAMGEAGELQLRYEDDVDSFYSLYARSLRRLGTPVMPKKFLQELLRVFASRIDISFVDHKGVCVAGLFSFHFKECALPYYVGMAPGSRECRAHDFIYWSAMRRAISLGHTIFDFGRSKINSGPYQYKKLWGAVPQPLSYQYKLIRAHEAPGVNPNNPKFLYFSEAWKKLPLPVANIVGPVLAPNFP